MSENAVSYVRMVRNWDDLYFPKGCGRTEGGVQPQKPIKPTSSPNKPTKPTQTKTTTTKHHQHTPSIRPAKPQTTPPCKNCQERPRPQPGGTGGLGSPAAPGGVPGYQDLKPTYRKLSLTSMTFHYCTISIPISSNNH